MTLSVVTHVGMYAVTARIVVPAVRCTIATRFSIMYASDTSHIHRIWPLHAAVAAPRLFNGPPAMLPFGLAFARAADMMCGALVVLAVSRRTAAALSGAAVSSPLAVALC